MAHQSERQKVRQRAGFLAENLLQRHFERQGGLAISFARRHLDEAGESVGVDWIRRARLLARSAGRVRGLVGRQVRSARPYIHGDYRVSRDEAVVRTLLGFCDLIRWENGVPILSEVKSQLGPSIDYRIEFQATQLIALREMSQAKISVSIVYYVALPRPRFVEVPWSAIPQPTPAPRESDIGTGYRYRTRVPIAYRDASRFTFISEILVPYAQESELLDYLGIEFRPGSRPGLRDLTGRSTASVDV